VYATVSRTVLAPHPFFIRLDANTVASDIVQLVESGKRSPSAPCPALTRARQRCSGCQSRRTLRMRRWLIRRDSCGDERRRAAGSRCSYGTCTAMRRFNSGTTMCAAREVRVCCGITRRPPSTGGARRSAHVCRDRKYQVRAQRTRFGSGGCGVPARSHVVCSVLCKLNVQQMALL